MKHFEYKERLEKEIKQRKIEVELSKKECETLMDLCGRNDITLSELMSSFIGDLVDGVHSNGTKGRDLAQNWFSKTLEKEEFDEPESLLRYLFMIDGSPDAFLMILEDIQLAKEDIEDYKNEPENFYLTAEEVEDRRKDLKEQNEYYNEYIQEFLKVKPGADIQEEIQNVKKWEEKRNKLSKGYCRWFYEA